ncbi:MAG: DUF4390 domain-containing protein [Hydrogenophaga sp.]|jgi:hypothetical protein|nr:DUF4390 domain-containing protein [Hydrogenophaga sp.]
MHVLRFQWASRLVALLGVFLGLLVHAQPVAVAQEELLRTPEAVYLTARLNLSPGPQVEDALLKGVPLYFAWQAEVIRPRWYWTNKQVASAHRTLRLVYQPLTRRWRVSLSNDAAEGVGGAGLQYALHQNFDSLADALAGVGRVYRWKIADAAGVAGGDPEDYRVEWSMRLDLALLPRPFQIGVANQPDWNIQREGTLVLPAVFVAEQARSEDTVSGEPAVGATPDPAQPGR